MHLGWAPVKNYQWWGIWRNFKRICKFFQNLCENNDQNFKRLMSEKPEVSLEDKSWKYHEQSFTKIFTDEIKWILDLSQIGTNEATVLDEELDKEDKVLPMLQYLLVTVNEFVTGPCNENQKIVMAAKLGLHSIIFRSIDDLAADFQCVKNACVKLMLALTEGDDR
jgi:hypothetical protein